MASSNLTKTRLIAALEADDGSTRLKAALAIGSNPNPELLDMLVARCAIEPDFYVRDMLTWALIHFPPEITVPRLLAELHSECAQARSQALHTLSKIKDASAWPALTRSLMSDSDEEVGRGNREMQLSLSSALVALGEMAIEPALKRAMASNDPGVNAHASATERLLRDPDAGFQFAVDQVKRIFAPGQ